MNWTEVETLHKEGHDIASHTMNHANLSDSSKKSLEYQIGKSKNVFRNMELTQQVLHIRLIEGRTTKLS